MREKLSQNHCQITVSSHDLKATPVLNSSNVICHPNHVAPNMLNILPYLSKKLPKLEANMKL